MQPTPELEETASPFSRKLLNGMLCFSAAVLLGFLWFQLLHDEREILPPGFTLPAPLPSVPPAENGLLALYALRSNEWAEDCGRRGNRLFDPLKPWAAADMQPFLNAAPAARARAEKCLAMPFWQDDPQGDGELLKRESLLHKILLIKSFDLSQNGQFREALEWAAVARRLETRWRTGSMDRHRLAQGIVAADKMNLVLFSKVAAAAAAERSDTALAETQTLLSMPLVPRADFLQAMAADFLTRREQLQIPGTKPEVFVYRMRDAPRPEWLAATRFKRQATINVLARQWAAMQDFALREGPSFRLASLRMVSEVFSKTWPPVLSFNPNAVGEMLASSYFGGEWAWLDQTVILFESLRRCQITAVAVKRWSLAHDDKYPSSLHELVPAFLPEVQMDPYAGDPIHWDATSGTVFCTGEDGSSELPVIPSGETQILSKQGSAACLK